jgi:ABC-type proline/glycine betaine transport system permease subunit
VKTFQGRILPVSGFKALRYILTLALITVLSVGINTYAQHIPTVPECALENHHGLGNCPVQTLRWYPQLYKVSITELHRYKYRSRD